MLCVVEGRCRGFQCFSGLCLREELQHDLVSDCPGLAMEDEATKTQSSVTYLQVEVEGIKLLQPI